MGEGRGPETGGKEGGTHLQLPTIPSGHWSDELRRMSPLAGVNMFSGVGSSARSCTSAPARSRGLPSFLPIAASSCRWRVWAPCHQRARGLQLSWYVLSAAGTGLATILPELFRESGRYLPAAPGRWATHLLGCFWPQERRPSRYWRQPPSLRRPAT